MGIELSQYRARIGSFNGRISNFRTQHKRTQSTKYQQTYRLVYLSVVILIPIIIGSLAAIYKCEEYQYSDSRKTNLQSKSLSGQVSGDIATSFIAQYTLNVLAASSFSML